MTYEEAIKKLESTVGAYLLSGNADETTCGEWTEILNTLKEEKEQENTGEPKIWKPQNKQEYWFVNSFGEANGTLWADEDIDEGRYKIGNCYHTEEECKFAAECMQVEQELKDYADKHNAHEIIWHRDIGKFSLYYNHIKEKIEVDMYYMIQQRGVYFTSEKVARAAIEAIGEERLKKYYFKVVTE